MLQLHVLGATDLRTSGGAEVRAVVRQPKRLALLAFLALEARGHFVRRDVLLARFWPELDGEHARAALRRAVYFLRKALGGDVIASRGDDEVAVPADVLVCDAARLAELLERGDRREALALYRGDLLPGFYVSGAPEAEAWLDATRDRLRGQAVSAAWALAETPGAPSAEAAEWGHRARGLAGDDEGAVARLMRLLARLGDTEGALAAYANLERRLHADADEPAAETRHLASEIRGRTGAPDPADGTRPLLVVAVLPFGVHGDASLEYLGEGSVALLTTALDGLGELRTITSQALLTGLAAERGADGGEARAVARLGATHVLRGNIVEAGNRLRIVAVLETLRGDPVTRAEAQGEADAGLFEILDRIVQQLAAAVTVGPASRIARVAARTTEVLPALRAYLRGERAFRLGRYRDAIEAYDEAVRLDAGFALAWYRLAGARAAITEVTAARFASRQATAHGDRLAPHDRLLVEAQDAWLSGQLPEAERRYGAAVAGQPDDLEAWYLLGDCLFHAAPYHGRSVREAREPLERALALDPSHLGALGKLARLDAFDGADAELDAKAERYLRLSPDADQALAVRTLRAFRLRRAADKAAILLEFRRAGALAVASAFSDAAMYAGAVDDVAALGALLVPGIRSPELRALCRLMLGHLALARGRVSAAREHLDAAREDDARWSLEAEVLLLASPLLPLDDARAAAARAALTDLDPAADAPNVGAPLDLHNALHTHIRLYGLGLLAARAGDTPAVAGSAELLAELEVPRWADPLVQRMARTLDALVRRARGDLVGALTTLEGATSDVWFQFAVASPVFAGTFERLLRAELLLAVGRGREAAGWLTAIGERSPWELPFVVPARRLEARRHAASGDPAAGVPSWREVQRGYDGADGCAATVAAEAAQALASVRAVLG